MTISQKEPAQDPQPADPNRLPDPIAAIGAARRKATHEPAEEDAQTPTEEESLDQVQPPNTRAALVPRIIREGLIDAILLWLNDYLTKLNKAGTQKTMIVEVAQTIITIEALKKDLECLERSIELVGRDKADELIEKANQIRSEIFDRYEHVVSQTRTAFICGVLPWPCRFVSLAQPWLY